MSDTVIARKPPNDGRQWDCQCARCGSSVDWEDCPGCGGEGVNGHDCGEDCCSCAEPEENVRCTDCGGAGGWRLCLSSEEYCEANPIEGRGAVQRGMIEWFTFDARRVSEP